VWYGNFDGVCVPLGETSCGLLSESLCVFSQEDDSIYPQLTVIDAPCILNHSPDDDSTSCVSEASLIVTNCADILSNSILIVDGDELSICDDADKLFNLSFSCLWLESGINEGGLCVGTYYLTQDGMF
jgi:hypothetical protein